MVSLDPLLGPNPRAGRAGRGALADTQPASGTENIQISPLYYHHFSHRSGPISEEYGILIQKQAQTVQCTLLDTQI